MSRRILLFTALFGTILSLPASYAQDPARFPPPQLSTDADKVREPLRDEQLRRMQKERALDRHKQIKKDTDELLALATQLKEYVDKTDENILSVNVVRKAEEIEKLAKHVKTSMRESIEPNIH